jgi:MFS family permease
MFVRKEQQPEQVYTPALILLAIIVSVSFLGFGFVAPLRAVYGKENGANSVEIGLMTSSYLLAGFISSPFVGRLADSLGYRKVLGIGVLLHAVLMFVYIPFNNPILLILLRGVEGAVSASVLPPARALVNGLAPRTRQGEALGFLSSAQSVGFLLGPVIGTFLASNVGYASSFCCAGILLAVSALPTLFLPEMRGHQYADEQEELSRERNARALTFSRPLLLTYLLQLIIMIFQGVLGGIWSLFMLDRGASLVAIGLSFTTFAIPLIIVTPFMGRLSDRYGRFWFVLVGLVLYGVSFFLYSEPITVLWIIIFSMLEGVANAVLRSGIDGMLADLTPASAKGRVQANYTAAGNLGDFIGATASGLVYALAPNLPFVLSSALCFLLACTLFYPSMQRLFPNNKKQLQSL